MPYFLTALALLGAVALHFFWQRRFGRLQADLARERQSLQASRTQHDQEATQKAAEQHALFNSMTEGVLILDQAGRVQLVNRSLQEFFGLKNDVRGQTIMATFRVQELAASTRRLTP